MISIENILKKEQLEKLSKTDITSINEALNTEINTRSIDAESDMKKKFDVMVEGLSDRFNNYVNKAIVESVSATTGDKINKKMLEVIQSMVNLLENSGIPVTEKTIETKEKLRQADEKLKEAYEVRETLKKDLDNTQKENFIYNRLQGSRPEIVAAAIEHFKNKDILEVEEEIDTFLNGDLSELVPANDDTFSGSGEFDLDKVKDALDEIKSADSKLDLAKATHDTGVGKFENADFDKLGKGLKKPKITGINRMSNITEDALSNATAITENDDGSESSVEEDTKDAMDKINDFGNLGYGFTNKKSKK